jgi:GT2 family glycosyltransferase
MINNTFVINPVRPDYIERCLATLYKYTNMKNNRVIVVDQTLDGLKMDSSKVHLYLRPHRNLGFAKSMNEGAIHGVRWGSKYITCMNDDIEFMDKRWWDGILETFKMDDKIMAVNPNSPREPGWGYGLEHGKYIDLLPYKEIYTKKDYDFLLEGNFAEIKKKKKFPENFPDKKVGVIDAIATWCTTFRGDFFKKIGYFEEKYYPGGGEDYDLDARVYSKGLRMVGTTRSWVWHWWGSSKDKAGEYKGKGLPVDKELVWMNPDALWPPERNNGQKMDPWGKWTDNLGNKHPMYRVPEVKVIDI